MRPHKLERIERLVPNKGAYLNKVKETRRRERGSQNGNRRFSR
jgi:hypothetical protein